MDLQISSELRIWSTGRCHIHLAAFSSLHSRGDIAMPSFSPRNQEQIRNKFFALQKHSNPVTFQSFDPQMVSSLMFPGFSKDFPRIFQDHHSTNQSSTRWQSFHPWSRWRSPWRAQNGMCVCVVDMWVTTKRKKRGWEMQSKIGKLYLEYSWGISLSTN